MSKFKVVCPVCLKKENKTRAVIELDSNDQYFICPVCGEKIDVKEGEIAYKNLVNKYLRKSQRYLFYYGMPQSAYDTIAYLLNIDKTNFDARAQHLISLLEMSTVRKCYFNEASALIANTEFTSCITRNSAKSFVSFCRNVFTCCKEYHKTLHKRLCVWKYFYDTDCVALYYRRTVEINRFLESLLILIEDFGKPLREPQLKNIIKKINEYLLINKEILLKGLQTIDGATYLYKNLEGNKTIISLFKKGKRDFSNDVALIRTLEKQKGKRQVKDNIFGTSDTYLVALKCIRVIGVSSLLLLLIDLILHGFFKGSQASTAMGIIGTILLGIIVLCGLSLLFVRALIKNRKAI